MVRRRWRDGAWSPNMLSMLLIMRKPMLKRRNQEWTHVDMNYGAIELLRLYVRRRMNC